MDPNATLADLRVLASVVTNALQRGDAPDTHDLHEAMELFHSLDRWLSTEGFLPERWAR